MSSGETGILGRNFPVIDKIDSNGVATGITSKNLILSYQSSASLESSIKVDVCKIANFNGDCFKGIRVRPNQITGRQLQIVVPNVTLSPDRIQAINNAVEYARHCGVEIIIMIGK